MGRVVLHMGMSLDGYMAGPGGDLSWHRVDEAIHQHFNDELRGTGAFLEGRRAYELMSAYWPDAGTDPDASPATRDFAEIWRRTPTVVFSRTLTAPPGPGALLRDHVDADVVEELRARFDGDLVVGGADLGREFLRQGLVEATRVYVHPVLVGDGAPLFLPTGMTSDLRLVETRAFDNGVVLLRHEVQGLRPTG